jgi:molecular chaperone Hsp33
VLHRLFWEERSAHVIEPLSAAFCLRCSRERVRGMLRSLGRDESDSLIAERGQVEVGCEFCGQQYRFDAVDVGGLFTPQRDLPDAPGALQ